MAKRIRLREVSPRELVEAHLRRIEEVNPAINAFVCVWAEQALAAARHMETALPSGLLAGVPLTVKDSFDVAGWPTLCGSRLRAGHRAEANATAVARLQAAGAILLGKTNVPELLGNYETDNFVTGRTNHPLHPDYTPGGSSGGEAAAIAACCSAGGLGSDGGGSIRIPAHFCGIVGFKPTHRRISAAGHFPPLTLPAGLMASPGPMARTVVDVALLFQVLEGIDPRDSLTFPKPERDSPRPPRIGVWPQFYDVPVDGAIQLALKKAADTLAACGFAVEEVRIKGLERAPNLWAFFFDELAAPGKQRYLAGRLDQAHWTLTEFLRDRPMPDLTAIVEKFDERERLRALILEQMRATPILLTPPASIAAFRHGERRWQIGERSVALFAAMAPATIWNLFGFPAITLPFARTENGLPVSVQLVGRPFEDELLLETAQRLEAARPQ